MEPHLASWSKPGESLARSTHLSRGPYCLGAALTDCGLSGLSEPAASVITAGGWRKLAHRVGLSQVPDII